MNTDRNKADRTIQRRVKSIDRYETRMMADLTQTGSPDHETAVGSQDRTKRDGEAAPTARAVRGTGSCKTALRLFSCVWLLVAMMCSSAPAAESAGDELTWPREFQENGTKVDIYEPQIEKWEGVDFETRSAVAITAAGSNAPVYGVFWMKAQANVDKAARVVTLNNIEVTKAAFPSDPELQNQYLALIRKHVPVITRTVALDHLEANYAISEAVKKAETVAVRNDVPKIIYSSKPALLVLVDGPPVLRTVPRFGVERVINTSALIVKRGYWYYLNAYNQWYESVEVEGRWSLSLAPPAVLNEVKQTVATNSRVDLMASN